MVHQTADDIINWLELHNVQKYTLIQGVEGRLMVIAGGDVDLSSRQLTHIGVDFYSFSGSFYCQNNKLTSLLGAPKIVGGDFFCTLNQLTTLEHGPTTVAQSYFAQHNQLTSLDFAPQNLINSLDCSFNSLATLRGAPKHLWGDLICHDNTLTSLCHCPEMIGGVFNARNNDIADLVHMPTSVSEHMLLQNNPRLGVVQDISNFGALLAIQKYHIEIEKIKIEQKSLDEKLSKSHQSAVHKV